VVELRVPAIVKDPFREHYRALIVGSLLRAAEAESARQRAGGRTIRARRAVRVLDRVHPAAPVAPPLLRSIVSDLQFGTRMKQAAAVVWFATLGALVADIVFLGVDSYATAAADLGLVAMTLVWFFACFDDVFGTGGSEQVGERGRSPAPLERPTAGPRAADLVVRS